MPLTLTPNARRLAYSALVVLGIGSAVALGERGEGGRRSSVVTVGVSLDRPLSTFAPARALGAGVDGHARGDTANIYTPPNLRAMRSAGLGALSYRLRTELAVEAWHWNPRGHWSDPHRRQGYWSSSSMVSAPDFGATYGYRLPRRGNTTDQANNDGYSRLDDGDRRTFWKSNPYLDPGLTREGEALHPQWILIDLGRARPIDTLRLDWAAPYARQLRVEHWLGADAVQLASNPPSRWQDFPHAEFAGTGGRQTMRIADRPIEARFVRVLMTRSSHTHSRGARDPRDRLGFAVREAYLGRTIGSRFRDQIRHAPGSRQTSTFASSTDPWHRATDIDRNTEQPSFSRLLRSRLAASQPILTPVPVLYGTPEDAAGELRYLRALHYPVRRLELGEEPDGQLATPEDYGALYIQYARALRRINRRISLGGPGYQTSTPDWVSWPDARGNRSWTNRFVSELRRGGALTELGFFSFEWYPFDDGCAAAASQLAQARALLSTTVHAQRADGLPMKVPMLISEYGYSAFATRQMVDLPGALLNADIVAEFLSLGGQTAYLYGYEPDSLISELSACDSWGNLTLFRSDDQRRIKQPVAAYWAARLLTREWTEPGFAPHTLLATSSSAALVSAYALRRPDGRLATLLINKDPKHAHSARIALGRRDGPSALEVFQLSPREYVWHPHSDRGYAKPDRSPAHAHVSNGLVTLPAYSVSVARTSSPLASP